jgi:hypothetical protein
LLQCLLDGIASGSSIHHLQIRPDRFSIDFVLNSIINIQIGISCRADSFQMPLQQQAVIVGRSIWTTALDDEVSSIETVNCHD